MEDIAVRKRYVKETAANAQDNDGDAEASEMADGEGGAQAKKKPPKKKPLGVGPTGHIPKQCPHCDHPPFAHNQRLNQHIAAKHPETLTKKEIRKFRDPRLAWVKCEDCRQMYVLKNKKAHLAGKKHNHIIENGFE